LLAAAVLAAPLYPADVFHGELSPFAYSAYEPAFYNQAFAPHFGYNYFGPSRHFSDYAAPIVSVAAPITYTAPAPITQYVHVPVVAPQVKYVEVPVPTPVVETKVVPEVKTVVVTKVVESAPAPAPAPVQLDSRESAESAESVEVDSRED
jgi:hypothetical protein